MNSFVALSTSQLPVDDSHLQYLPDLFLEELGRAYVGFLCQDDRGDISTEKLTLRVKRGSLAFSEEFYPACIPYMSTESALLQSELKNSKSKTNQGQTLLVNIPAPSLTTESLDVNLSPIPEVCETPGSFLSSLAGNILKLGVEEVVGTNSGPRRKMENNRRPEEEGEARGGVEEFAARVARSLLMEEKSAMKLEKESDKPNSLPFLHSSVNGKGSVVPQSSNPMDSLTSHLTTAIVDSSLGGRTMNDEAAGALAQSIITDALAPGNDAAVSHGNWIHTGVVQDSTTSVPIVTQVARQGSLDSGKSSRSSSLTGEDVNVLDYTDEVADAVLRDGLSVAQYTSQSSSSRQETATENKHDLFSDNLVSGAIKEGLETIVNGVSPRRGVKSEQVLQSREITPTFPLSPTSDNGPSSIAPKQLSPMQGRHAAPSSIISHHSSHKTPQQQFNPLGKTSNNTLPNPRLLTPIAPRVAYAWSTASTQDEGSRPNSPFDLDNIGLSLSNNTEEFTSLFSKMVISHAIGNVAEAGVGALSPKTISSERDNSSLTRSSKIGIYLSQLGEAEPPCDGDMVDGPTDSDDMDASHGNEHDTPASYSASEWTKVQMLRPIATGNWGCGSSSSADPQLKAMIQWVAATACGRPHLLYCTTNDSRVKQVSQNVFLKLISKTTHHYPIRKVLV